MLSVFEVSEDLLSMYRERMGNPAFWAEPMNAITNASFLIAAALAWVYAIRKQVHTPMTQGLLLITGLIGFGSFAFHTIPNYFTIWFDMIPIALFQMLFLWLSTSRMLCLSKPVSASIVVGVVGCSFAFFPASAPLNGSLFYFPTLLAMLTIGLTWSTRVRNEPYLLAGAAVCFAMALTARTVDKIVPWDFGSHFLWHTINGLVVYLVLRSWIVFVATDPELTQRQEALA